MALHKNVVKKKNEAAPVMYKSITVKATDLKVEGRTVCGYLAAFGNIDSDKDRLFKGCFAKSIAERGPGAGVGNQIAHLWQHKMDMPLGKYTILREDDYGLYFEAVYDNIQKANEALEQFQSGTLKNFSIGYCYVWDKMEFNEADTCFDINEVVLFEGSVVTLAANDMALYVGMKGKQKEDELQILLQEAGELIATLKPRKRFMLGQVFAKMHSLSNSKPPEEDKETLRKAAEEKALQEKAEKGGKKNKFAKLALLSDDKQ